MRWHRVLIVGTRAHAEFLGGPGSRPSGWVLEALRRRLLTRPAIAEPDPDAVRRMSGLRYRNSIEY